MDQAEHTFTCPYCWEAISMVLDTSAGTQSYVEDCENCCHPILITYSAGEGEITSFQADRAQ
jgi:hypothetical protein